MESSQGEPVKKNNKSKPNQKHQKKSHSDENNNKLQKSNSKSKTQNQNQSNDISWNITLRNWTTQSNQPNKTDLSVMSYNILSPDFTYFNKGVKKQNLNWNHRRSLIEQEISYFSPDLVCLQEFQLEHGPRFVSELEYEELLAFRLRKKDLHTKRDIKTVGTRNTIMIEEQFEPAKSCNEGCALYYKKSRFSLIYQEIFDFSKYICNKANLVEDAKYSINRQNLADRLGSSSTKEISQIVVLKDSFSSPQAYHY